MTHLMLEDKDFKKGYIAYFRSRKPCPYTFTTPGYFAWTSGWNMAHYMKEQLQVED
jgi:ribosome modulation factor